MKNDDERLKKLLGSDYDDFLVLRNSNWIGPFTIANLLDACLDDSVPKPPDSHSVYLVTEKSWERHPLTDCIPLYIGSTTGRSPRFRTRIGDLIADMFGFFQKTTGHSAGGVSLHNYCKSNSVHPKDLYIGWLARCGCTKCAEYYFWHLLEPELNRIAPPSCRQHKGRDGYLSIID